MTDSANDHESIDVQRTRRALEETCLRHLCNAKPEVAVRYAVSALRREGVSVTVSAVHEVLIGEVPRSTIIRALEGVLRDGG